MKNADIPATPCTMRKYSDGAPGYDISYSGLTKRELFAAMAMQGLQANSHQDVISRTAIQIAYLCVEAADALLEALEEK